MINRALQLSKQKDKAVLKRQGGIREHLRMYKKQLSVNELKREVLHPNYFSTLHYKIGTIGLLLIKDVFKKASTNDLIKIKEAINKNVISRYKILEKELNKRKG